MSDTITVTDSTMDICANLIDNSTWLLNVHPQETDDIISITVGNELDHIKPGNSSVSGRC